MKAMIRSIFVQLSCLTLLLTASLFAHEFQDRIQDKGKEFHFKLDITDSFLKELVIKIPDTFSSLSFDMSRPDMHGREFVPHGESFESWSEIISFQEHITLQPCLKNFINRYIDGSKKVVKRELKEEDQLPVFIVLEEIPAIFVTPVKNVGLREKDIPGQTELIGTKVIQGKFSFAVAQYTIRYKNDLGKEAKQAIKQKILSFLKDCRIEHRERKEKATSPENKKK